MSTIKNAILSSLPSDQYQRLLPSLEPFEFSSGRIMYDLNDPIDHFYFPVGAMVSLVTQMSDGKLVEVGLVGNDGIVGMPALFGERNSAVRAVVQIPNGGFRAP